MKKETNSIMLTVAIIAIIAVIVVFFFVHENRISSEDAKKGVNSYDTDSGLSLPGEFTMIFSESRNENGITWVNGWFYYRTNTWSSVKSLPINLKMAGTPSINLKNGQRVTVDRVTSVLKYNTTVNTIDAVYFSDAANKYTCYYSYQKYFCGVTEYLKYQ